MEDIPSVEMSPLLAELNPEQRAAVTYVRGPLLVLAGAGTGKTRVITTRIANLLAHGVQADSIVAVSFTRKAGNEMKSRLSELLGEVADAMRISTFHSLGLSILREQHSLANLRRNFGVCDAPKQLELCCRVLSRIESLHDVDPLDIDARAVLRSISLAKNSAAEAETLKASACPQTRILGYAIEAYNAELHQLQLVDLDDMVRLPVKILEANTPVRIAYQQRYEHLMIDEYQDTNLLQHRLMRCLIGPEKNICVVGDDAQSIYGFRGAKRDLILGFEREFPGANVVTLSANYRCSSEIIGVANAVIKGSPGRYQKRLVAANGSSVPVRFVQTDNEVCEHRFIAADIRAKHLSRTSYSDIAVLVRVQHDTKAIRKECEANGIPCGAGGINLMTLHGSKGLEFPVVYVPGVIEDKLPHWNAKQGDATAIEEERRLFYVGVTRARQELTLTSTKRRGSHSCEPSRFAVGLIEQQLVQHQQLTS